MSEGLRDMIEEEISDLKEEIEHFKREKERVRGIVGSIGGMPTFNTKLFNTIFLITVVVLLIISFMVEGKLHLIMSDLAIFAISLKIMLLMHNEARVNHFELWVLTSLEWKLNEISKQLKKAGKDMR